MILLIRASHANEFELQNYKSIKNLEVITSHHPLTPISLPTKQLWSPTDLPAFPFRRQLLNRLIGGEQWLFSLKNLLRNGRYHDLNHDIIHTAETYSPYTHQAVQLRKAGKIAKLICTCWETIPHANEKFTRLRKWKAEAYQYVELFHTPTQRAKQALITEGVDPAKIMVIAYGVDLTRFRPVRKPRESWDDNRHTRRPRILTVARLSREKGMADLELVARALPQFDFLLIGHGSHRPEGPNIQIQSIPYTSIHTVYQSADLFFLPSRTTPTWEEQYGMALVEAMASGLPIVTTDSGAIPEVVGPAGIIVKAGNTASMIKSIDGALSYECNIDILSSAGRTRAQHYYDASKISAQLSQLYR